MDAIINSLVVSGVCLIIAWLVSARDNKKKSSAHHRNNTDYEYVCIICNNKMTFRANDDFNTFACKNCRSIYSYEWKNDDVIVDIVKKEAFIPDDIRKLVEYFGLTFPIDKDKLKNNYRQLVSQYHPDKVANLGKEIRELSERKTKEIIENYEAINNWINEAT